MEAILHDSPGVLSLPILQPCLRSKQLLISVGTHMGIFLAHMPPYPANHSSLKVQKGMDIKDLVEIVILRYDH